MVDVLTIGAATIDIFIKSSQFVIDNNLVSLEYSSKNEINQSLICSGGGATNSAVSFSRLGLKSSCLSLIGDDYLNNYIYDDLKKESVNTNLLIKNKKDNTDFSVVLVAKDGSRSILTNRGKTRLEEKYLNWDKIPKTKWFYITSLEGNLDLLEKLIGFAKENNIKVALNPGNRELEQRKKLLPLLKLIDFLILNKTEAESIVDLNFDNEKFWNKLVSLSPNIFSVTNGHDGAFVFAENKHYFSPVIKMKAIDETGAGDAFGSTFVSALIYQKSISEAVHWAIKNSASVVSALGAKTKLLTLKKLEIGH
ncbi:MAG: carbohydrate kinase family protein [Candidatus Shapirobacteria bacterium]|nr:carbohydrate kinase family protein [Candidatus Shapirobacteria bacterium]